MTAISSSVNGRVLLFCAIFVCVFDVLLLWFFVKTCKWHHQSIIIDESGRNVIFLFTVENCRKVHTFSVSIMKYYGVWYGMVATVHEIIYFCSRFQNQSQKRIEKEVEYLFSACRICTWLTHTQSSCQSFEKLLRIPQQFIIACLSTSTRYNDVVARR